MKETICKNCGNRFQGNYCNLCGQSADTHEMNVHYLLHDIQHGLFHVDKGILFTIKELFTRPGYTIKEFIEGKRVKHFKPFTLVIILAGVYGFLYHFFHINMLENTIRINGSGEDLNTAKEALEKASDWVSGHYAFVSLLQLPIYAFGTYLAFKKSGYNFVQHLVLNAFLTGQRLILHIVLFPLFYYYSGTPAIKNLVSVINILYFILLIWALFQFFKPQKKIVIFLRTLLSLAIFLAIMGLIALIGGYIYFKTQS